MDLIIRTLKFTILEALSSARSQHKFNLIGKGYGRGGLESALNVDFGPEQRHSAVIAFDELIAAGLIRPTYTDIVNPEDWVEITDAGRRAFARRALDSLDDALLRIDGHLVELREGAWAALAARRPDGPRQAAHSARELIDQTLKTAAPDIEVRAMADFKPDTSSQSGITRRHRLKYLLACIHGSVSGSDLKIVEQACDLTLAVDEKLKALSHSRETALAEDARDALVAAEMALRRILVRADTTKA
jgi:hypothetical protein